jgi:hypothetical protein
MSKIFRLFGFASPTTSGNTFSTPVFSSDDGFYVQVIGADDRIVDFEAIDSRSVSCQENCKDVYYKQGDRAIYAVRDQFNYLTVDGKDEIRSYLRSKIKSYIGMPFFYRAVSEFCNENLAEYAGCESSRDYLLRQVLANFAKTYQFKSGFNYYRIQERHFSSANQLAYGKGSSGGASEHVAKKQLKISHEEYADFFETYHDFIQKAAQKHKNIAKEKVVSDSIYIGSHILPVTLSRFYSDTMHDHLVMVIQRHLHSSEQKKYKFKYVPFEGKQKTSVETSAALKLSKLYSDRSTLPALSLMLFVYSIARQASRND